jgi:poly(A)-specific ribonuclease
MMLKSATKFFFIVTGISYLSRAQESAARVRIGNPTPIPDVVKSSSNPTVADSVFIERIKSRVKYWRNACKDSSAKTDGKEDNAAT